MITNTFILAFLLWPFSNGPIQSVTCQQAATNDCRCVVIAKAPLPEDVRLHVTMANGKQTRLVFAKGSTNMQFAVGSQVTRVQSGKQKFTPKY